MIFFSCFILAMLLALSLIPPLIRIAPRWNFVDAPGERKVHTKSIPRIGGLAIVAGTLVPMLIWLPTQGTSAWLILSIIVLLIFGVWDDRKNLHYKTKFSGQFLAAFIVVVFAGVRIHWLPFIAQPLAEPIACLLTIVVVVAVTNALNLVDGLDGLAGGTTLLGFMLLALLAYLAHDDTVVIMCLGITGATLGFLRFNTHPANIFMGDTGSQFLGFGASIVCIRLTQQTEIKLSPLLPLILLGIPIFDTMAVMLRRMAKGTSPFFPDRNHIHHRLLDMGFDHYEVVVILYVLQGFLSTAAFLLRYADDTIVSAFITVIFATIFGSLHIGDRYPGRFRRSKTHSAAAIKHLGYTAYPKAYATLIKCLLGLTPTTIIVLSGYYANSPSMDLGVLTWAICLLFFITSLRVQKPQLLHIEHIALYILCSICAFLLYKITANTDLYYIRLLAVFLFAFTCFLLIFPPPNSAKFELTPLDYLVLLVAAFLAELPVENLQLQILALCLSCLIMLLYITEYIIANEIFTTRKLRAGTLITACALALSLQLRS